MRDEWQKLLKREKKDKKKNTNHVPAPLRKEVTFFPDLLRSFLHVLNTCVFRKQEDVLREWKDAVAASRRAADAARESAMHLGVVGDPKASQSPTPATV